MKEIKSGIHYLKYCDIISSTLPRRSYLGGIMDIYVGECVSIWVYMRTERNVYVCLCLYVRAYLYGSVSIIIIIIISCLAARISLTLSRHSSLSFIALGRSSGQQPVFSHICWMYVRAGRPAFARPCVGIHKSTSLMSSSLLLQQCPACLVRLTWIVFVIGGRVAVQLVSCGVLLAELVQDCSQHSFVIAV